MSSYESLGAVLCSCASTMIGGERVRRGRVGREVRAVREDQSSFCSELVAAAYRRQRRPLTPLRVASTSPADLALSPELSLRDALKRE